MTEASPTNPEKARGMAQVHMDVVGQNWEWMAYHIGKLWDNRDATKREIAALKRRITQLENERKTL